MTGSESGGGPEDQQTGTWATETLPLAVRKELLERELNRLGLRRAEASRGKHAGEGGNQQEPKSPHPKADSPDPDRHAD
ncbi:MAG TPA: hypothetical protein VLK85_17985 [Ramlibacter sp.]|nr:hypothetical protein [Ramlibacter sp.]